MSDSFQGPPPSCPRLVLAVAEPPLINCAISVYPIVPPANPLAAGWRWPFHCRAGIQTSIFTSVSPARLIEPLTRQNAGRSLKAAAAPSPPRRGAGDVNAPASTSCADVTVVFGSDKEARLSQDAAACAGARPEHQKTTAIPEARSSVFFRSGPTSSPVIRSAN